MSQEPNAKHLIVCVDLDGMLLAFPTFFKEFFTCLQAGGNKIRILTARPEASKAQNLAQPNELGITPDFYVGNPDDADLSDGVFKAVACNQLGFSLL
jgi:hypothetical protein